MKCKPSKQIFDAEWFHQLMWEATGSHKDVPREDYSEFHALAVRMAKVMEIRLRGEAT